MFTNADCTVFHKTIDKKKRLPEWQKHIFRDVYWENSFGQSQGKSEMKPSNSALIIIPATSISDFLPCKDDIIAKGIAQNDFPSSDFQQSETVHTILSVSNFMYGSLPVQHLEVKAV
jgi:hypothetical protein